MGHDKFLKDLPLEEAFNLLSNPRESWGKIHPEDVWIKPEDAPGYNPATRQALYRVSDHGRVFSVAEHNMVEPYVHSKGVLMVTVYGKRIALKKLVGMFFLHFEKKFLLLLEEGVVTVNHKDGDTRNNHVDNLFWSLAVGHDRDIYRIEQNYKNMNVEMPKRDHDTNNIWR